MKFECLKCGECCRNLLTTPDILDGITLGLFLKPNERKLFPKEKIVPMYGAGLKGRSRPRPKVIFAYQLTEKVCPHLDENNLCKIYDSRPISCRAYPLDIALAPVRLGMSSGCFWVKKNLQNPDKPIPIDVPELKHWTAKVLGWIGYYAKKYSYMWIYDLETRKWYRTRR